MMVTASGQLAEPGVQGAVAEHLLLIQGQHKNKLSSAAPVGSMITLAARSTGCRKMLDGNSGAPARCSITTNAPSRTAAAASEPMVRGEDHPAELAPTRP